MHPQEAVEKNEVNALLKVTELARVTKLGLNSDLLILRFSASPYNRSAPFT